METTQNITEKQVVTVELPVDVVQQLRRRAKENQRSLSGEVRFVLISSIEKETT
jgi:plasmid stability protein